MPRSRSRSRSPASKRINRRRSRSRERRHRKKKSRSRSPRYRGSPNRRRSPSPRKRSLSRERDEDKGDKRVKEKPEIDSSQLEGLDEEQIDMMKQMGFASFDTTKGKKVEGNNVSAVNIQRKRRYRQYMNRKGGFNRPLDFIA